MLINKDKKKMCLSYAIYLHKKIYTIFVIRKKSMPSMDQPRHGVHVITTAEKWAWDEGLLKSINAERKRFELPVLSKLDNTRVRIIIAIHSHAFSSGYCSYDELKKILSRVRGNKDKIKFDEELMNSDEVSHLHQ